MYAWKLPTSLTIGEVDWQIRTDFRIIIDILIAFENPDYDDMDKWLYCLMSMREDFDSLPMELYQEACQECSKFIDLGQEEQDKKQQRKVMDWEQDAQLIIPAVNKVVSKEIRSLDYLHWWTFMGYYMEIGDKCLYSQILNIRLKKSKGQKLEKWEQKFYQENKAMCDIKTKLSEEEMEEQRLLDELFG